MLFSTAAAPGYVPPAWAGALCSPPGQGLFFLVLTAAFLTGGSWYRGVGLHFLISGVDRPSCAFGGSVPRPACVGALSDVWEVKGEPPTACDSYYCRCSRTLAPALGTCRVSAVRLDGSPFLRVRGPPLPLVAFLELTLILPDISMAAPASFRTPCAGCQRPLPPSLSSLELGRV